MRTISGLTLVSRFAGLARDLVSARVFQDTLVGSAFAAAFAIPNLFRRLLGEGALAAAFLPEHARLVQSDREQARSLVALTLYVLLAVTSAITVLGEVLLLLALLGSGDNPERALSIRLVMVMLPFMPMVCVAAIMGAALQVHGRFAPSAGGPILLNLFIIAAAAMHFVGPRLDPIASGYAIGIAALLAGLAQIAWCLLALRGKVRWRGGLFEARGPARRILIQFLPVAIGLGAIQLNALLDTVIAMWPTWIGPTMFGYGVPLDERANAILSYSQRLYQFPLGVFGIAVATAAFPALSRLADDRPRFQEALRNALSMSLFIGLPATIGLVLVRDDLTRVMFGGASGFSEDGLARSSAVLLGYGVGVWAYSLNHVLVRGFFARGDTRTPMRVALGGVGLNLVLNLALIWPMGEAGLAWSTAASQIVQFGVLLILSRRRLGAGLLAGASILGIGLRSLAMGLCVVAVGFVVWSPGADGGTWSGSLGRLSAMAGMGIVVYAALAWWARCPELAALTGRTQRRGD